MMEFRKEPGRIFSTDETGKLLAEVTFPEREGVAVINHTFVDGSLRGQGVAGQLLRAVADNPAPGWPQSQGHLFLRHTLV